jgi:hypothetical protein
MSSTAILDVQCVLDSKSEYLIKEMSVVDTITLSSQHWIFKHSRVTQIAKSRSVNKWLERNYHNLSMEHGDVEYEEVDRILNSLKFNRIYVKGEQKQKIIQDFIPHVYVINIEDLGCPRLNLLCHDNLPCCIFHMDLNPKQCSFQKVFALRKWYLNNCH